MRELAFDRLRLRFVGKGRMVDLRQPGLGHSSFSYEFAHPSLVQRRPLGAVLARGELLREFGVVDSLDNTIDPAEAKSFFDRIVVGDPRPAGLFLVVDEPNLALGVVMLRQPAAPFFPADYIQ